MKIKLPKIPMIENIKQALKPKKKPQAKKQLTPMELATKNKEPFVNIKGMDVNPDRIWIDHVEEQTIEWVLDAGYWAGMTLYPVTKCSPRRAVDILEKYSTERLLVNSSADWGPSDPFTLQECIVDFQKRGHSLQEAVEIFHNNPCRFLGQNPKWDIKPIQITEG